MPRTLLSNKCVEIEVPSGQGRGAMQQDYRFGARTMKRLVISILTKICFASNTQERASPGTNIWEDILGKKHKYLDAGFYSCENQVMERDVNNRYSITIKSRAHPAFYNAGANKYNIDLEDTYLSSTGVLGPRSPVPSNIAQQSFAGLECGSEFCVFYLYSNIFPETSTLNSSNIPKDNHPITAILEITPDSSPLNCCDYRILFVCGAPVRRADYLESVYNPWHALTSEVHSELLHHIEPKIFLDECGAFSLIKVGRDFVTRTGDIAVCDIKMPEHRLDCRVIHFDPNSIDDSLQAKIMCNANGSFGFNFPDIAACQNLPDTCVTLSQNSSQCCGDCRPVGCLADKKALETINAIEGDKQQERLYNIFTYAIPALTTALLTIVGIVIKLVCLRNYSCCPPRHSSDIYDREDIEMNTRSVRRTGEHTRRNCSDTHSNYSDDDDLDPEAKRCAAVLLAAAGQAAQESKTQKSGAEDAAMSQMCKQLSSLVNNDNLSALNLFTRIQVYKNCRREELKKAVTTLWALYKEKYYGAHAAPRAKALFDKIADILTKSTAKSHRYFMSDVWFNTVCHDADCQDAEGRQEIIRQIKEILPPSKTASDKAEWIVDKFVSICVDVHNEDVLMPYVANSWILSGEPKSNAMDNYEVPYLVVLSAISRIFCDFAIWPIAMDDKISRLVAQRRYDSVQSHLAELLYDLSCLVSNDVVCRALGCLELLKCSDNFVPADVTDDLQNLHNMLSTKYRLQDDQLLQIIHLCQQKSPALEELAIFVDKYRQIASELRSQYEIVSRGGHQSLNHILFACSDHTNDSALTYHEIQKLKSYLIESELELKDGWQTALVANLNVASLRCTSYSFLADFLDNNCTDKCSEQSKLEFIRTYEPWLRLKLGSQRTYGDLLNRMWPGNEGFDEHNPQRTYSGLLAETCSKLYHKAYNKLWPIQNSASSKPCDDTPHTTQSYYIPSGSCNNLDGVELNWLELLIAWMRLNGMSSADIESVCVKATEKELTTPAGELPSEIISLLSEYDTLKESLDVFKSCAKSQNISDLVADLIVGRPRSLKSFSKEATDSLMQTFSTMLEQDDVENTREMRLLINKVLACVKQDALRQSNNLLAYVFTASFFVCLGYAKRGAISSLSQERIMEVQEMFHDYFNDSTNDAALIATLMSNENNIAAISTSAAISKDFLDICYCTPDKAFMLVNKLDKLGQHSAETIKDDKCHKTNASSNTVTKQTNDRQAICDPGINQHKDSKPPKMTRIKIQVASPETDEGYRTGSDDDNDLSSTLTHCVIPAMAVPTEMTSIQTIDQVNIKTILQQACC